MKRHLRFFPIVLSFLVIVLVSFPFPLYGQGEYIASKFSIKYHRPNCRRVLKIQPQNRLTFKKAKDALEAGYSPCTLCKPPTQDLDKEKQKIINETLGGNSPHQP